MSYKSLIAAKLLTFYRAIFDGSGLTATRTYALPDKSGTVALLTDIVTGMAVKAYKYTYQASPYVITLPSNCYQLGFTGCAGGNSGGKYSGYNVAGGAGGAHIINYIVPVNGGETLTITVGKGGAARTTDQGNGYTGSAGTATIITLSSGWSITLPGGTSDGIYYASNLPTLVASSAGGANAQSSISTHGLYVGANGGSTTVSNGGAFHGFLGGAKSAYASGGGASYFGAGGAGGGDGANGKNAQGYGAGGGGTVLGAQSGAGGDGVMFVVQYLSS